LGPDEPTCDGLMMAAFGKPPEGLKRLSHDIVLGLFTNL